MVKENIPEYSVTEISKSIKQVLDDTFGYVRVRGEISGLKQAASGHVYLNLKDESAIINGIIWKSNVSRLSFQPHDGLEVICKGRLTTGYSDRYSGRSDYSIHIDSLMPAGEGALMALLEQRKKKFAASGLFDQIHKKQIPEYPHRIGVITSPTGAVIQDILHRIEERYPLNVILWPVPVQGDDSSELITQAIRGFNNNDIEESIKPDVIIVARGGGSIEDLWAFNEENIVNAVFESKIPIISAIGHETDTTLIDLVSDLRAPTPTAAAEFVTPVKSELYEVVRKAQKELDQNIEYSIDEKKQHFKLVDHKLPANLKVFINTLNSNFLTISSRLNTKILREQLKSKIDTLNNYSNRIRISSKQYISARIEKINSVSKLIESLSYKSVINRGYAVIRNSDKKPVQKISDILSDNEINIELKDGILEGKIDS
ncbi:MAG: exodeoxyribonuclease VII large subunit [Pelagibacterales bacterium]|nr:exodeoxyribonuclease VII large subunit [Pelagibacterales bacterium]